MDTEIVKADKTYRNRLLSVYLLAIAIGSVLMWYGLPALKRHFRSLSLWAALDSAQFILIVVLLSFIPAAVFLIMVGRKVLKHGSYPYPGMKVIRDTRVLQGRAARLRGKALIGFGIVSILLSGMSVAATSLIFARARQQLEKLFTPQPAPAPLSDSKPTA